MFPYKIRPVVPEKDAAAIALLVKDSFRPWLDRENLDYLEKLRREGLAALQHPFWSGLTSFPYRLDGVVCHKSSGELLGLINTYYFYLNGRQCCLLANVCVRDEYRGEGIASRMLQETERIQTEAGVRDLFLQARLSKPETVVFYRKRGFRVTDYRETWVSPKRPGRKSAHELYRLEPVSAADESVFRPLFAERYPASVLWNLNYKAGLFRTGVVSRILNFLESPVNRFRRAVDAEGRTAAWAVWQKLDGFADQLWMVPGPDVPQALHGGLLSFLRDAYAGSKPLKVDCPAGASDAGFKQAGFCYWQTLTWMWKGL